MGKKLICLLGIHKRENCKCVQCGKEVHRYDERLEWKPCEPPEMETSYGVWLMIEKKEYRTGKCIDCGKEYSIPTGMVSGW
jgi:hypothetical protein